MILTSLGRATGAWAVGSTPLAGAVLLGGPGAPPSSAPGAASFEDLLVWGCGLALTASAAWLSLVSALVAVGAVRGRTRRPAGVPAVLHGCVLRLCGVALVAAAAAPLSPAGATPGEVRSDDGTTTQTAPAGRAAHAATTVAAGAVLRRDTRPPAVRVEPGDSLWSIAADTRPHADDADLAAYWPRLHALNRDVVGPDPDLLHPGQRLRLPPPA